MRLVGIKLIDLIVEGKKILNQVIQKWVDSLKRLSVFI